MQSFRAFRWATRNFAPQRPRRRPWRHPRGPMGSDESRGEARRWSDRSPTGPNGSWERIYEGLRRGQGSAGEGMEEGQTRENRTTPGVSHALGFAGRRAYAFRCYSNEGAFEEPTLACHQH